MKRRLGEKREGGITPPIWLGKPHYKGFQTKLRFRGAIAKKGGVSFRRGEKPAFPKKKLKLSKEKGLMEIHQVLEGKRG